MESHISIFKPSRSPHWYLQWTDKHGRRQQKSTRCKNKRDALQSLTHLKDFLKEKQTPISLSEFTSELLCYAEANFSEGTVGIYRATLELFSSLVGNIQLSSITPLHFDRYKTKRLKTLSRKAPKDTAYCIKPVTVNLELRTLRAALNTACRWELIEKNPFANLKLCEVVEESPIFFTKDDFQKLINNVKEGWLKEIIVFATLTGMRRGELANLRWSDVDFPKRILTIQNSATFRTKNGKKRIVPLNDTALYILQSKANKNLSELVFTLNDKKIYPDWMSSKLKKYVVGLGLQRQLHFHSLRHTFASWLVQDGVSLFIVSKLLGHSDTKTTEVYSHLQPVLMHDTVNKIQISYN